MHLLKTTFLLFILLFPSSVFAQSVAWKRANNMGKGINLSWMDQRWNGTAEENHRDYIDLDRLPYIKEQIQLIHTLGFQLLRFPVCFELWYNNEAPYELIKPEYYAALDSVIKWTGEKKIKLIIDNHHGTLKNDQLESDTKRICAIWSDVAYHYKNTDVERIFFEIFNEPNQLSKDDWEYAANKIIPTIRKQLPYHTLIAGASEWNGLKALQNSTLFSDHNIIYTFHFYDPFIYTHQGADWVGAPASTTGIPYPYRNKDMPSISLSAAATWAKGAYEQYPQEGNYEAMLHKLSSIKEWSTHHDVPILCGEWGAYKRYSSKSDRCQYLNDVYAILETLKIPNAMWEWDAGFSFFDGEPALDQVTPCMQGKGILK